MAYAPAPVIAQPPHPHLPPPPSLSITAFLHKCPPPPPFQHLRDISTHAADYFTLVCYGVFSFLIGLDVWRAYKKRAIWLPGKAFALTGVTVQIIVWWTTLTKIGFNNEIVDIIFNNQIVVAGRVAVCVFIGYLLPRMSVASVLAFVALAITICAQIASELLLLLKRQQDLETELASALRVEYIVWPQILLKKWSTFVDLAIFVCVVVLGLILGYTILASKPIHGLLKQRVSAISSIIEEDEFRFSNKRTMPISWNDFEYDVLRSWFVARVCQADYVISRSVLSSAVGILVTISIIVCFLSNTIDNLYFGTNNLDFRTITYAADHPVNIGVIFLLFSFIILGWIVICWRWLVAQMYFRLYRDNWRKNLWLEDFWSDNIIEMIHVYDLKRYQQRVQISNSKMSWLRKLRSFPIRIFTQIRLHKLLYLVLMIQLTVVFFSKLCGLLLEVIVGRFVYWFHKPMSKRKQAVIPKEYKKMLECLCMPGEDPFDLWEANQMSFKKEKLLMKNGCEEGSSSKEIHSIFCLYSLEWVDNGIQLLQMLQKKALPSVLNHFPSVEKQCVKMTVVSLITIFIKLQKAKSDHLTKIVKGCGEAWDLLTFVDEYQDNEVVLLDDFSRDKDQV